MFGSAEENLLHSVFQHWGQNFESAPNLWSRFPGRYSWVISKSSTKVDSGGEILKSEPEQARANAEVWLCEIGPVSSVIHYGSSLSIPGSITPSSSDCEIRLSEEDFLLLAKGYLNPQLGFAERRIVVRGRTKHVLRFNLLLDRLVQESTSWFSIASEDQQVNAN